MTDTASTLSSASKVMRMLLQSLVLTAGALLVIEGKATGGVIFASSILCSRALAPVEQAIANWRGLVAARQSWHRMEGPLAKLRQDLRRLALPRPLKELRLENTWMDRTGRPQQQLAGITFRMMSCEAMGTVAAKASAKTSLDHKMTGILRRQQR